MQIKELFKGINYKVVYGSEETEIETLEHISKKLTKNGLFFCIEGKHTNGFDYCYEAIKNGAVAIVVSKNCYNKFKSLIESTLKVTTIVVGDVRNEIGYVCSNFYNANNFKFKLIGITGTNGKTTTTMMIANGLMASGKSVAVVGTSGVFVNGDQLRGEDLTTPDPIDMYKLLSFFNSINVEYVVTEVSAHALDLNKINGLSFSYGIFSNLTEDHLDYFGTMENYGNSKAKFFSYVKVGVFNTDDSFGKKLYNEFNGLKYSYGKGDADYKIHYKINKKIKITNNNNIYKISPKNLGGEYNAYNACSALIVLLLEVGNKTKTEKSFSTIPQITGRLNEFDAGVHGRVVLDFAHTPDGLEKLLSSLKAGLKKNGKLISVFGCGGNRDKVKRSIMGKVSAKIADYTIISIDNPRYEDPSVVMADIESGVKEITTNYKIVMPRERAIKEAISMATKNDIIAISGKGTEPYYEVNGDKLPYREDIVIKSLIKNLQ